MYWQLHQLVKIVRCSVRNILDCIRCPDCEDETESGISGHQVNVAESPVDLRADDQIYDSVTLPVVNHELHDRLEKRADRFGISSACCGNCQHFYAKSEQSDNGDPVVDSQAEKPTCNHCLVRDPDLKSEDDLSPEKVCKYWLPDFWSSKFAEDLAKDFSDNASRVVDKAMNNFKNTFHTNHS